MYLGIAQLIDDALVEANYVGYARIAVAEEDLTYFDLGFENAVDWVFLNYPAQDGIHPYAVLFETETGDDMIAYTQVNGLKYAFLNGNYKIKAGSAVFA